MVLQSTGVSRIALISIFSALAVFGADESLPVATNIDSYTVLYTGRMLGNFRMPALQLDTTKDCPAIPDSKEVKAFEAILNNAAAASKGTVVRVAAGDNIAPFLLSREFWHTLDDKGLPLAAADQYLDYKWNPPDFNETGFNEYVMGNSAILADNVACFLMRMGFDAIVPGKHEFYFGPEYLRQVERLLLKLSDGKTRMLGSNLVLHTRPVDTMQPSAVGQEPTPPGPSGTVPAVLEAAKIVLPSVPLPWMRTVRILNALKLSGAAGPAEPSARTLLRTSAKGSHAESDFAGWLKKVRDDPGKAGSLTLGENTLQSQILKACIVATPSKYPPNAAPICGDEKWNLGTAPDNAIDVDLEYELPHQGPLLELGKNYSACFILTDGKSWSCSPFTVRETFFEYSLTAKEIPEQKHKPWILKEAVAEDGKPGLPVALFGVVDPDLMQSVGRLNYTWAGAQLNGPKYSADMRYETVVEAAQPGETLKQIVRYCLQDPSCEKARKVLVAQLPEQDAYGIVGQLQALKGLPVEGSIDVIVSQGDVNRASGDRTIIRSRGPAGSRAGHDFNQPVVLVPGDHVPTADPFLLRPRIQQAIVTPDASGARRIVRNTVFETDGVTVTPLGAAQQLPKDGLRYWLGKSPSMVADTDLDKATTDGAAKRSLELIALKTMQETCHADAALLQHRDIFFMFNPFFTEPVDSHWAAGLIDAIFWKGDFIECLQVTGDTINNLLKRSQELENNENNGVDTDYSLGWSLATLGLDTKEADPAKRRIGGAPLDPKKLYSVAITDYLANGDTGYPILQTASVLPVDNWNQLRLFALTDAIKSKIGLRHGFPNSATELLDTAYRDPRPKRKQIPGAGSWVKGIVADPHPDTITLDRNVQQRTLWSIDLYKSDASVNLFLHNGNETQLGQRFPGVTATDLSSPNSETFAFDYSLRIERSDPLWSIYIESDLNYGHKASHTPQNTYQRSETADYFYHEVGLAPNLWPRHRNASTLKLLLPAAFRTQVWPTITQITPGFDTAGAKSITTEAPNLSYTLSLRPGLRFDYVKPKPDNPFALPGAGQAKAQPGTPQIQTGQFWTSYIEGGYEVGRVLNGPSAFQFNYPGVASPTVCAVTAVQFIPCLEVAPASTAAAPATATVLAGRNHSQAGFYLDFRFDAPVPRLPTVEFLVENRGDFYVFGRPEDTPVDTRLYNDLKASLVIPIPGLYKLSLSPTFEWIVYRNRIIDNTYYGVNAFVSLSYSFGWRQGLEWRKVLGFSNPTPALSTLPTR